MSLTPGVRLGVYEVTALLGEGGMGQVFRARDAKLNRDVALKVLPDSFANDAERLARFTREAQTLAALNHPNIAAIYGLEESAGVTALVMELVEGEDLSTLIARGNVGDATRPQAQRLSPNAHGLPVDEALPIARQIAEALEAAHEQGIIHRDLKPANIKVRSDGTVKVLDFGLAKALDKGAGGAGTAGRAGGVAGTYRLDRPNVFDRPDLSASPTITSPAQMTGMGVILGTAAYMSPEQAKGRRVDKRTDIWAFGCVLFEMLTGTRPFEGDDVSDVLASVLKSDPDWNRIPRDVPERVVRLVRRCLVKDQKFRIPDIAVARFEIDEFSSMPASASTDSVVGRAPSRLRQLLAMVAVAALSGTAVGVGVWMATRPIAPSVARLTATPLEAASVGGINPDPDVAISPDGSRIVYVRSDGGAASQELVVRALDRLDATPLKGLGTPRSPFISPDGNWVGYFDGPSSLKKVAINGGSPVTICDISGPLRGASWGPDDTIVFAINDASKGLLRVSAGGGTPELVTKPDAAKGELAYVYPEILPDGLAVVFTIVAVGGRQENAQIAVLDLQTRQQKILIAGGTNAHYAQSGHLVYGAAGSLRAVPFDLGRRELRGSPVPVAEHVATKGLTGAVSFSVARNGTLAYVSGDAQGGLSRTLVWADRQGHEEAIDVPTRAYAYPRLSPDGMRVALDIRDQENDIWIWSFALRTLTRLTFDPGLNRGGIWSPDGKRIAFTAQRDSTEDAFWQAADGTGTAERLSQRADFAIPMSFSPDGARLLFGTPGAAPYRLGLLNTNPSGDHTGQMLLSGPASEANGEISPDGRWLAYQSNESGRDEIYVRPFPAVDTGRWQVSADGGTRPAWAHNGRELFYYLDPGKIMAVPLQTSTTFTSGTPQVAVNGRYVAVQSGRSYDVSQDDKHFLMIKDATPVSSIPTALVVVLNWTEELKRLAPPK